jgi:electron transfer flavoprotein alpha subunit
MSNNILIVTEHINGNFRKPSFESISEGRRIADKTSGKVIAIIIGSGIDDLVSIPGKYGADVVLKADNDKLNNYNPSYYSEIIAKTAEAQEASIILMPATTRGRDLAPRIAAKLDAGLASDCLQLIVDDNKFEAERPLYAGKVNARISVDSAIKIATLRPNVFKAQEPDNSKSAAIDDISIPDISSRMELKEFRTTESSKMDITESDIIITGGRGMKGPENFKILEELAGLLGGVVGATRAAVDAGWCPHSDQVGQTGKTVSPNLYMMAGASGSIQHWAGMSGSKCIVAINKDPEAPIMKKADYSIIGDLFEVVPVLTEEIKKIKG